MSALLKNLGTGNLSIYEINLKNAYKISKISHTEVYIAIHKYVNQLYTLT